MTIAKILEAVNVQVKNSVNDVDKKLWLAQLDGEVVQTLLDTHEGLEPDGGNLWVKHVLHLLGRGAEGAYTGSETPLIPFPYDELYVHYLCFKLYLLFAEYERASAEERQFKERLYAYGNYCNRTYRSKQNTAITTGE